MNPAPSKYSKKEVAGYSEVIINRNILFSRI